MQISVKEIKQQLYAGFGNKYKAFGGFIGTDYWNVCLEAICDETLLSHIIFCNDVMQIPPTHTFLRARPIDAPLSEFDKRAIGAFWGYVFKSVFGYVHQKSVTARVNTVRTASYFSDPPGSVEILK